jgi:hypothetical protein
MQPDDKSSLHNLLQVLILALSLFQMTATHLLADAKQDKRAPVAQTKEQFNQASAPRSNAGQSKESASRKKPAGKENPPEDSKQKKLRALSLVDAIVATADRITPVEYSILVQIEAATLLWQVDQSRALYSIDPERGLESVKSSIWVLNRLADGGELSAGSMTDPAVASWVSLPSHHVKADEILDLSEMIGTAFREIARHDAENALSVALGLNHRGLQSLAQLAISSVLLNEANNSAGATQRRKTAPR